MRSIEEKGSMMKKSWGSPHHRSSLGKATPSKWDDAEKWLVKNEAGAKASPRNSNACLIPKKEWEWGEENKYVIDECDESARGICLRDMGTEMTPLGSKEPSRAATPVRNTSRQRTAAAGESRGEPDHDQDHDHDHDREIAGVSVESLTKTGDDDDEEQSPLEARAAAWEEAERAKYTARYKRQQVRIQAWENHEKNKAEMENRKVEVKAEQMKSRAKEKCRHRRAAIERIAEEKRAVAEAKLNENAMKKSEKADYIRRNGHLPSFFSFFNFTLPWRCCPATCTCTSIF